MGNQKYCKEDILALDVATNTGYYSVHDSGSWCFIESKIRNDNKAHKAFRDTVMGFIQKHNIKLVVAEGVNVGTHFNAVKSLSEFHGILLEICDELNLPEPVYVNPTTLKKFATNNGRATKLEMIRACKERYSITPINDDHADSILLFKYYCQKYRVV